MPKCRRPPAECTTVKCSRDLKRVVSGCDESVVVKECATGLGCAEGACIEDACQSAELAKGSVGCSFYTLPPAERVNGSDQCFAAMLANTWDLPVNVTAELGSQTIDISRSIYTAEQDGAVTIHKPLQGPIPPGAVAVIFLSQGQGSDPAGLCPPEVVPAFGDDPNIGFTGMTRAFRLNTNLPVTAYSIYPYGGARTYIPSATLLLPTSAWSTNYLAVDGWPGALRQQKPFLQIGGTQCPTIPSGVCCCDTLQQQIPPLSQWGREYALVPYPARLVGGAGEGAALARDKDPYRIVGAVDGTKLTYDPEVPSGAPETLAAGRVVSFMTNRFVTVKSQDEAHPFYASVYMTSMTYNGNGTIGDPDFVNIVPSDQFLDRYVFSADYSYPKTSITLVRKKTANGFKPVELACAGVLNGWQALDSKGE